MAFLDQAVVFCSAGAGGNGCVSFRREKCIPFGGPNGGDGGDGGSIILKASSSTNSLAGMQRLRHIRAEVGHHGAGSQKTGADGKDTIIELPLGTCIFDADAPNSPVIVDLCNIGQTYTISRGGKGGLGNMRFKSSTNRAPRHATKGEVGEDIRIRCELRVMADIGLLGLPNAGKSSLLRQVSNATPKVADYAFTTVKPHVGVVWFQTFNSFVMADIPGLIEGASQGLGMGDKFLKHLTRCKILLHVIDATLPILDQLETIEKEVCAYEAGLDQKPRYLALNKVDLMQEGYSEMLDELLEKYDHVFPISALTGKGCPELVQFLGQKLSE
jgi:GTP-binding protein